MTPANDGRARWSTQQRRKAEATMPAQVTRTTADQRPNAYIPVRAAAYGSGGMVFKYLR